ncbi:hypothetical protein [Sideroxydans sp. CL21]|uniref:hypothetical protein n=1 Tax=Sideroxydans sp. CL21 TaxID=2600596 RepID=UPI0024BCDC2D|nr:hypothetical protein [Sideroxydans sp. CL21]
MSFVEDEEILYRSISFKRNQCARDANGNLRLSSQSFTDPSLQPSVDRARLFDNDPCRAQKSPEDGIVSLVTIDVRNIKDFRQTTDKGKPKTDENGQELMHAFDVIPDPVTTHPVNPAHALITSSPGYTGKSAFKRLIERLARLAENRGWIITPQEQQ